MPLLPLVATAAAAASWGAPQDVGSTTARSFGGAAVAVGANPRAGIAVLTERGQAHGRGSVVVLRRTRSDGRLGTPLVLARNPRSTFDPAVDLRPDGAATAAWIAYGPDTRNQRLYAARLAPRQAAADIAVEPLTGAGSSAYDPGFVPGLPGPVLSWARRTGPRFAARFPDLATVRLGLPVRGVEDLALAGTRAGRVLAVFRNRTRVRVAVGSRGGAAFAAPATVPGSTAPFAPAVVGMDSTGAGAVAWAGRSSRTAPTEIAASAVPAGATAPTPAVVLATPARAPTAPVLAAREGGGAYVAWGETTRTSRLAPVSAGTLHLRLLEADGSAGAAEHLGDPGERGRALRLTSRGGNGVTAVWVTASGALRGQDVAADGTPGPARTLDRGVDPYGLRVSSRGAAVTYRAGSRVRLVVHR